MGLHVHSVLFDALNVGEERVTKLKLLIGFMCSLDALNVDGQQFDVVANQDS